MGLKGTEEKNKTDLKKDVKKTKNKRNFSELDGNFDDYLDTQFNEV